MPENNPTPEKKPNITPNLLEAIEEATEYKEPVKSNTSFEWNFDEKETPPANETKTETTAQPKPEPKAAEKKTETKTEPGEPVTDKVKRESAITAVGMLDILQQTIFTPIISYKYKKKFTDAEIVRLDETNIIDQEIKDLAGEDLILRNKWNRLMKKCGRKLDEIPLTDPEKKSLENNFYSYFDVKQKSLPIEWLIGFAIINSVGKRTIDVFTD